MKSRRRISEGAYTQEDYAVLEYAKRVLTALARSHCFACIEASAPIRAKGIQNAAVGKRRESQGNVQPPQVKRMLWKQYNMKSKRSRVKSRYCKGLLTR